MPNISLFDSNGNRKYLTPSERQKFASAAKEEEREYRTFCLMLLHTGCRISEVLNLGVKDVDYSTKSITVETLKQRKKGVFRQIPLPDFFLDEMNLVHNIKRRNRKKNGRDELIWGWSRRNGLKIVKRVMEAADIKGIHATPKGLRHAFAIACMDKGIQLNMVQKWLGHSSPTTTAIYANALGEEERSIASRLWE